MVIWRRIHVKSKRNQSFKRTSTKDDVIVSSGDVEICDESKTDLFYAVFMSLVLLLKNSVDLHSKNVRELNAFISYATDCSSLCFKHGNMKHEA